MKNEQTESYTEPRIDYGKEIVRLGSGRNAEELGGKGRGLDRLLGNGFSVPPGFVITPAAFTSVLEANGRDLSSPGVIDDSLEIPEDFLDHVMQGVAELSVEHVAVRSSAAGEDGGEHSFAGQYESTLMVPTDDREAIARALRHTWGSYFSDHAVSYRRRVSEWDDLTGIAVVVQSMVDADFSGVIFTVDPVRRRPGVIVMNVVEGLGDRLVSGAVTPEEYVVERSAESSTKQSDSSLLDDRLIAQLRDIALQIEKLAGVPQDIEFAIADREISILQARPVTTVGTGAEGSDRLDDVEPIPIEVVPPEEGFWEFSAKDFQRPVTPLTVDIYINAGLACIPLLFERFGILIEGMEFRSIGGNPYVRVIPPGGKDGPTPPPFVMRTLIHVIPALRKRLKAARKATKERLVEHYVDKWHAEERPELTRLLKEFRGRDLSTLSDRQLLEEIETASGLLRRAYESHFLTLPAYALAVSDLYFFAEEHLGWSHEQIGRLTHGTSDVTSAGPQALGRMARRATQLLGHPPADSGELEMLCRTEEEFAALLEDYMDHWGLVLRSYDFDSHVEAESRESVLEQVVSYAAAGYDPERVAEERAESRRRAAAEARVTLGAGGESKVEEFDRLLSALEVGFPIRDDTGFVGLQVMGSIRMIAFELGRRLADRSLVDRPEHVVYLSVEEIRSGVQQGKDWRSAVALRRGERKWAEMNPGPASYGKNPGAPPPPGAFPKDMRRMMRGIMWVLEQDMAPATSQDDEGGINGIPASAGIATGLVRIIRDVRDGADLTRNDILVCPVTNPAWVGLFPLIGGIITDAGGILSHPAIIAREFGVPAVVGTGSATSRLRDGDLVRIDGSTGRVEIQERGHPRPRPDTPANINP